MKQTTQFFLEGESSTLKCLNTDLCASMTQDRLSELALMYINSKVISVDRVMSIFAKNPRSLGFSNIFLSKFYQCVRCYKIVCSEGSSQSCSGKYVF